MRQQLSILLLFSVLFSCAPQPSQTSPSSTGREAHETLVEFFLLLNAKKYAEADSLYVGSYEGLQDNNPGIEPSNHVKLLEKACEINGFQCLVVRTASLKEQRGGIYVFQVEFNNPDGSLFVRGPCCGANETDMPPESQFEYRVIRNSAGKFLVMDLPPYVP